jgi:sugar lactone lactonase YvrE
MLVCVDFDGTELWTYDNSFFYYTGSATESMQGWAYASNKFYPTNSFSSTYYFAVFWLWRDNSPTAEDLYGVILDINGGVVRNKKIFAGNYDGNYYRPTNVIFNKNNLMYVTYRGIGTDDDRIEVYDTYLNTAATLSFGGDQSTLYSLCLADDEEDIWIIKEDDNAVYRYNQNLAQQDLIENDDFGNLNGICEDGNGGIFIGDYSSARKIWHYDANGDFIEVFDVTSYMSSIHRLRPDYFGGVWALDTVGDRLVRFASNGTFLGQVALPTPNSLDSTFAGCWVMSENSERLYFIDLDMNHTKTIDTTAWGGADPRSTANPSRDGDNWRSAFAKNIDVTGYTDTDDITSDPVWGTGGDLEWSEVSKDTNFVHHQLYHQTRITLRSDGSDTPEVEKIALPPTVELTNIPVQGYKNAYLKTVVASGTVRSQQSGKLRTWFSLEE